MTLRYLLDLKVTTHPAKETGFFTEFVDYNASFCKKTRFLTTRE